MEDQMATLTVEVLIGVCWFGMKISDQTVPVSYYFCVEECDRLPRPFSDELDSWMVCVDFFQKFDQVLLVVYPDGKCIIQVPPPDGL